MACRIQRLPALRCARPTLQRPNPRASTHHIHVPPPLQSRLHSTTTTSTGPTSVDPTEVNHFNALASSWWDPHGPSRLLHLMNPLRHNFIKSCLAVAPPPPRPSTPGQGLHYLDVGCGGGIFAESAARLPNTASVTGIDPSGLVLDVAKAHARRDPMFVASLSDRTDKNVQNGAPSPSSRLQYRQHGIEDLPLHPSGGYDVVTLFEVLEHVSSPSDFLAQVEKHVRPGGWLVLSTIARTWTSWLTTKVMAEGVLRVVPWGTHEWSKYLNEEEVRGWFEGRGGKWEMPRAMGVVYVPGIGWREVRGAEEWGNYFFGVRRRMDA